MPDLALHPDCQSTSVRSIGVTIKRPSAEHLSLTYRITGSLENLLVPPEIGPGFEDGLWRHTCVEAFLAADDDRAYTELNLSPSGRHAAYAFTKYRTGMQPNCDLTLSVFSRIHDADWMELHSLIRWPTLGSLTRWRIGLSAVIEETDGTKSYWALAHAPGTPDFHNPACFTATLPSSES